MNKLEFGKESQIKIIRKHQADEIRKEEAEKRKELEPMKTFNVSIEMSGTQYLTIEAHTAEEAEEEAKEDFEITECDIDIDYIRVDEVKKEGKDLK